MPEGMTRAEHLAWCKRRALEYVDAGDLTNAIASMTSDLRKHPETQDEKTLLAVTLLGPFLTQGLTAPGAAADVRKWIEGFN